MTQEPNIFPYIARLLQGAEVVWKPLGEVAELKRGTTITKKTSNEGIYPVISGGQQPAYYIDQFNREGETITVAGSGAYAGFVMYWNEPIFVGDAFSIKANGEQVLPRYIYHFLLSIQEKIHDLKSGGGVPHVYAKDVARFVIPLPPLSVQQEIVRILDKFTQLEAELEAELDCRKRQYEYYRNKLLTFSEIGGGTEIVWKTLGEVFEIIAGGDIPKDALSEIETNEYNIPILSNGINEKAIYGWTNISKINKPSLTISARGTIGWASYREQPFFPIVRLLVLTPLIEINLRYAYNFMKSIENDYKVPKVGIPQLTKPMIKDLKIPLPSLSEQQRIASILDKFDTLVNSISEGLPKEIALRRKQYEYYREKLLRFPKE